MLVSHTSTVLNLQRGLGNRLGPLLSGLAWLQKSGPRGRLYYAWNRYDLPDHPPPHPDPPYPFQVDRSDLFDILDDRVTELEPRELGVKRQEPGSFYYDGALIYETPGACHEAARLLRVHPAVTRQFHQQLTLIRAVGRPVVGVSIRLICAYVPQTHNSPLSWYRHRLRELKNSLPGLSIFLSTDEPSVQDDFERILGRGAVYTVNKTGQRYSSPEAILSSWLDMLVLSALPHLIIPVGSTLGRVAHYLRGNSAATVETANSAPRGIWLEAIRSCRNFTTRCSL